MTPWTMAWLASFIGVLIWSAISPYDRVTWWLEVVPAIIALLVISFTRKHFPLTTLALVLILVHSIILMVGGHYTYAEVPLGDWMQQWVGGERNNYDKLGHFAQGFVPAIIAREILIRKNVISGRGWLSFFVVCFCLAFSAFYELIEWWAALVSTEASESFLGTQGYVWDTQSDMMWALVGSLSALLMLAKPHDRQIAQLSLPSSG